MKAQHNYCQNWGELLFCKQLGNIYVEKQLITLRNLNEDSSESLSHILYSTVYYPLSKLVLTILRTKKLDFFSD